MKHLRLLTLGLALIVTAITAACGGSDATTPSSSASSTATAGPTDMRFVFDWPTVDFMIVPIVVAEEQGYFKEAGLNVSVIFPPDTATATKVLGTGGGDIGIITTTDMMAAVTQNIPVLSVGNYTTSNNWGLFSKPGTTVSIDTLKGKTISGFGDTWTNAMLPFVLKTAGLTDKDVKIVTVGNDTPLLLAGKVDLSTNTTNYLPPAVFDKTGKEPGVLLARDAGAPDVPIWVYAGNKDFLSAHADATTALMAALAKATEWAIANPDEAVAAYQKAYPDNGSTTKYNTAGWTDTAKYMKNADGKLFVQTDEQWTQLGDALIGIGELDKVAPASSYYSNEYLPQ